MHPPQRLPALPPGEPLRSVGLLSFPAGEERELLYNEHTGAARVLSYEDGDILGLCRPFRTAADHAGVICRDTGLPEANAPVLTSQISLLARSGLLVRKSDLLQLIAADVGASGPAPPIHPPRFAPGVDLSTAGGRINALILGSQGRRVLLGDGPLLGAAAAPPAFVSDPDPVRVETLSERPASTADLRAEHARVLGASPGDLATEGVNLDRLDARFLRRLRLRGGTVVVTQHGTLAPGGAARFVDRLVLSNRTFTLDGPLGLDNRGFLPPAPEIDVGAREVFLLALRKTRDRALLALLPGVVEAPALPPAEGVRTADVLVAILAPFEIGPFRPDGEPRLRALAAHLRSVAALSWESFRALVLVLLRTFSFRPGLEVPDVREAVMAYARLLEDWPRRVEAAREAFPP